MHPLRSISLSLAACGLVACGLVACAQPAATPQPAATAPVGTDVAFARDVAPLFTRSCAGCHTPGGRGAAKVELFDAAGAVSHANVSAKIAAIITAVESGKMPAGGKQKLTSQEVGVLKQWQTLGSPNN